MNRIAPVSLIAFSILGCSTHSSSPQESASVSDGRAVFPSGNNSEATEFAKAITEMTRQTWPQTQAVWVLELTPQELGGDILQYRKSVTHCTATISVSNDWFRQKESDQRSFINASLGALHQPPALGSKELDYYPNSSGEISIQVKVRAVAHGSYTKTKTQVRLELGTFIPDKPSSGQLSASVSISREGSAVKFLGTTNLSDGESILVTLKGHGYEGQTKAVVAGERFTTEGFSNRGRAFSPGTYSLQFNVFDPKSGLMVEAKQTVTFPDTNAFSMVFKPVKL